MSKPISISHISLLTDEGHKALLGVFYSEEDLENIDAHNASVLLHWRHVGSNASPAKPQSSSVMPGADHPSRVPAAGHGGPALEVMA